MLETYVISLYSCAMSKNVFLSKIYPEDRVLFLMVKSVLDEG